MNLNISTGVKEYSFTDNCKVYFNPTDPNFIEKVYNAFSKLDECDENYHKQKKDDMDGVEVFRMAREANDGMRAIIDELFGVPVCQPVFGDISVYARDDGLPLWANLMLTVTEVLDDAFTAEGKKTNPRLEKYVKKYQKK